MHFIFFLTVIIINHYRADICIVPDFHCFKNFRAYFYCVIRIEYDAYRTDLESLAQAPRTDVNNARVDEAQLSFQKHKQEFEGLRSDVSVKLKLLDENKVSVENIYLLLI